MKLTSSELRTFGVVADAFFPSLAGAGDAIDRLSASELDVTTRAPELFARLPSDAQLGVRAMLACLSSRAGGVVLFDRPSRFDRLDGVAQESALRAMAGSTRPFARQTFKAMRQLVMSLLAWPRADATSPLFTAIGYPGPLGPPPTTPKRLKPIAVEKATTWTCDVVVVGSGAGGGTAAAVLAQAGLDVVVLERGPYKSESDFTHKQDDADRDLYDARATSDAGVAIIQGRCLGGGTVVNYTTSLRTPDDVRAEWDRIAGFKNVFTGAELEASLRAVEERLSINDQSSAPWFRDRVIERGCKKLGWDVIPLHRNVKGCAQDERCGYCNFGCRLGAKQSTMRTWLEDATQHGTRIVAEADVDRVITEAGRAVGVRATVGARETHPKKRVPLTVFAKAVVVACGATYTPVLLARSNIASPALGRFLRLHPVTGLWGRFDGEKVDPWGGVMQARIGREFANLDGEGYGVRFESGAIHPVELMVMMPWGGAVDFKRQVARYREWSAMAILLRDRAEGRIHVPRVGAPRWEYALTAADQRHVREGLIRGAELYAACGASEVRSTTQLPVTWRPASGEKLASFVQRLDRMGYGANQSTYASWHPQGSARMGIDPRTSVLDESGAVHGVGGLYVMDGSAFPAASGVNPMVTIEALAHRAAKRLAQTLR